MALGRDFLILEGASTYVTPLRHFFFFFFFGYTVSYPLIQKSPEQGCDLWARS